MREGLKASPFLTSSVFCSSHDYQSETTFYSAGMSLWERFGSPFRITSGSLLDHLATPHRPFFAKKCEPLSIEPSHSIPPSTHPSSPEKTGHPLPDQTRCSGFPVDSEGEPGHDDHPRASISLPCERVPRSGQRSRWKDRSARKTARWVPVRTKGADQKVYLPSQPERSQSQTTHRGLHMDQNC